MNLRTIYFFLLFGVPAVSCAGHPFPNSCFAEIKGTEIHYRYWEPAVESHAGSVFLVHGFGASTYSWQQVADSLARSGFEVIAVDLPPFGYSGNSHRINQSFTAHAMRLHEFLHRYFPGRCWHMAGHSMGGGIVQAYALMFPEDLDSATFVSAVLFPELPFNDHSVNLLLRLSPLRFIIGEFAQKWLINEKRIERILRSAYGQKPNPGQVRAYTEPLSVPGTMRAILSAPAYHRELKSLDASNLEVPSLAVWGDADSWVPYTGKKPALDRMKDTELKLLEGVGHNPMETHFREFMAVWLPFLEKFRLKP